MRRKACSPHAGNCQKFKALGAEMRMEQSAGAESHFIDTDYADVQFVDGLSTAYATADLILRVTPPSLAEIESIPDGSILIGLMRPYESRERIAAFNRKNSLSLHSNCFPGFLVHKAWMHYPPKVHVLATSVD